MKSVDVILTSCKRWDLLTHTLDTFFRNNTYPVNNFYVYEDFGINNMNDYEKDEFECLKQKYTQINWVVNDERKGQIIALDILMSFVTTPYYFSLEDDWEFYREGFIEASLPLLESQPKCIQVWLRELNDTNSHPVEMRGGLRRLKLNHNRIWNGFSFNPALRRLDDYKKLGSYGRYTTFDRRIPWNSEVVIGKRYAQMGYFAAILEQGFVRHIGDNRGIRK